MVDFNFSSSMLLNILLIIDLLIKLSKLTLNFGKLETGSKDKN